MRRPKLIAVAGIIGVGKTTLAEKLAQKLQAPLIREEYDKNPFLSCSVKSPDDLLASELFFLFSRVRQLSEISWAENHNSDIAVCDYIFQKNRIYAQISLKPQQFAQYEALEKTVLPHIMPTSTVIYLTDTVEHCRERIARRGRDFEKTITRDQLTRFSQAYDELFANWQQSHLIRINCEQTDPRSLDTINSLVEEVLKTTNSPVHTSR